MLFIDITPILTPHFGGNILGKIDRIIRVPKYLLIFLILSKKCSIATPPPPQYRYVQPLGHKSSLVML